MSVRVRVTSNVDTWAKVEKQNLRNAQRAMGDAIMARATMIAPKLTGALRSDGRVETKDTSVVVTFGDSRVPYARKRHFENRKNPQTLRYLEKAGDQVVKEGFGKYKK
jgi:hypothetical protein